ncbi:MAG: asparaginase [Bacteroidetes bacterium]|nr:asparaginase [Bacteroidota bacterium]
MTNPILVEIHRGGILESFHRGVVCVVNEKKEVIYSAGDIHQLCYPRSAMKLLQVIPLIENGGMSKFGFSLEEVALMCGSHNAEEDHIRVLDSILEKIGMSYSDLECGAQMPSSKKDSEKLIKSDQKPGPQHNNCSGKHAGMLALCKLLGHETKGYIHPQHLIQQEIQQVCADMYEYPVAKMVCALDGCSAPIFSIPVYNQALAYRNLCGNTEFTESRNQALAVIREAVSTFPYMVAGSKRYCTDMMKITAPSVIGKTGAEGIFCMSFTNHNLGVCIKIDDGKMQPQYAVAQQLLEESGLFPNDQLQTLAHYKKQDIKNFNHFVTGEFHANPLGIKPSSFLQEGLS